MLICRNKIILICVIFSLVLQFSIAGTSDDLNYNESFKNIRQLEETDSELQRKIEEAKNNPAFKDPGFWSAKDHASLNTTKPNDITSSLNTELTLEESQRFSRYFQEEYNSNSSMLNNIQFGSYSILQFAKVNTNYISLVDNKVNDSYISVILHDTKSDDTTPIKAFFMTEKKNIVKDSKWIYDFYINDDFAFCYNWVNDALLPQVWKISLKAKTWGAKNTVNFHSKLYVNLTNGDDFEVISADLVGGPMIMKSVLDIILLICFLIVPVISSSINLCYLFSVNRREKSVISNVGYFISCWTISMFHLCIFIMVGILNIKIDTDFFIFIAFMFLAMGWIAVVWLYPIFASGEDRNGEPDINVRYFALHIVFYIIMIPLVCTVLAPFLLYQVYMGPKMYFLLGNMYIIPIIWSIIAKKTLNDSFITILMNGLYFGLFPMMRWGPGFWIDGFDMTWFKLFILTQLMYATFVCFQQIKGPRFFLSLKCMGNNYQNLN